MGVRSKELPGLRAIARDLSLSGLRIQTEGEVELGRKLDLMLDLDLVATSVVIASEVVWIKKISDRRNHFEAGIRFVSMTWDIRKSIESYINVVKKSLENFLT